MTNDIKPLISPWVPMTDPTDLKTLGKFNEELGECSSAASRCLIQGIDECEPVTGKPNRRWLQEEIADVMAGIVLSIERFELDEEFIVNRAEKKVEQLRTWHAMKTPAEVS